MSILSILKHFPKKEALFLVILFIAALCIFNADCKAQNNARISGKIVNRYGQSVPRVEVYLQAACHCGNRCPNNNKYCCCPPTRQFSNAQGVFTFVVAPGTYNLWINGAFRGTVSVGSNQHFSNTYYL